MRSTIIVGAGPAGAALAYVLASRGLPVRLLERQRDFAREFRGEGFQPSGIDALRQLGLGERFDALPSQRVTRLEVWKGARRLASMPVVEGSGALLPWMLKLPSVGRWGTRAERRFRGVLRPVRLAV